MTAIDLSTYAGLIALCLLTLNILLGLLLSVKYQPKKHFPYRHFNTFKIHNWTGYTALCVAGLHPILLLFSSTAGFGIRDILFPVWSPTQPLENTLGAAAFYLLAVVVITSYFRVKLGRKLWKSLHYLAYVTAALFFVHGLLTDPNLKNSPLDPFDAEKVLVEFCFLIVLVASAFRIRYAFKKKKQAEEKISL